jgi:hypothetical protein
MGCHKNLRECPDCKRLLPESEYLMTLGKNHFSMIMYCKECSKARLDKIMRLLPDDTCLDDSSKIWP